MSDRTRCRHCGRPIRPIDVHATQIGDWLRAGRSYAQIADLLEKRQVFVTPDGVRKWCERRGLSSHATSGPSPKLSPADAEALRQALDNGMRVSDAMRRWKITRPTVERYRRRSHAARAA